MSNHAVNGALRITSVRQQELTVGHEIELLQDSNVANGHAEIQRRNSLIRMDRKDVDSDSEDWSSDSESEVEDVPPARPGPEVVPSAGSRGSESDAVEDVPPAGPGSEVIPTAGPGSKASSALLPNVPAPTGVRPPAFDDETRQAVFEAVDAHLPPVLAKIVVEYGPDVLRPAALAGGVAGAAHGNEAAARDARNLACLTCGICGGVTTSLGLAGLGYVTAVACFPTAGPATIVPFSLIFGGAYICCGMGVLSCCCSK